jgi:hypothetical protein
MTERSKPDGAEARPGALVGTNLLSAGAFFVTFGPVIIVDISALSLE